MRKGFSILILLLALLIPVQVMAEADFDKLYEIMMTVDQAYYARIQNGEFTRYHVDGSDMENDPIIANYYVGNYGEQLMRPVYFSINHLDSGFEQMDLANYFLMYVEGAMKELLKRHGEEYQNEQILQAYADRNGVNRNLELIYPNPVYTSDETGINAFLFGMCNYTAIEMGTSEPHINDEMYALLRINTLARDEGFLVENCYIVTDQKTVYEIVEALGLDGSENVILDSWMDRFE